MNAAALRKRWGHEAARLLKMLVVGISRYHPAPPLSRLYFATCQLPIVTCELPHVHLFRLKLHIVHSQRRRRARVRNNAERQRDDRRRKKPAAGRRISMRRYCPMWQYIRDCWVMI